MKKIILSMVAIIFLSACVPHVSSTNTAIPETNILIQTETSIPTQTSTTAPTLTPTQTPSPTPTEIPPYIGRSYTGYWLKLSKEIGPTGSQTMTLYYQDGYTLNVIATFCVRAGDNNTPNGFYFIAIDRPTTYPTAHGGYQDTFFSHNFGWKYSFRNWYLHAAPWNTKGVNGCPTDGSGGCVNMRTEDFNIVLNGGSYTNPITGEQATIPNVSVGTPFVIVETENVCKYLGNCMEAMACKTGLECFQTYTCAYCTKDAVSRWNSLVALAPQVKILDVPIP